MPDKSQAIHEGRYDGQAIDPYFEDALHPSGGKQDGQGQRSSQGFGGNLALSTMNDATLEQVYTEFKAENEPLWDNKRRGKFDQVYRIMIGLYGKNCDLSHITPHEVRRIKSTLAEYPSNASKKPLLKDKPLHKQIEIAKRHELETISRTTINSLLFCLRLWFQWAVNNRYISENPFEGIKISVGKSNKPRRSPYTDAELKQIFSAPTWTGMRGEHKWKETGHIIIRDMRYWMPLIAVHTGMRPKEIAQLNVGDVQRVNDL